MSLGGLWYSLAGKDCKKMIPKKPSTCSDCTVYRTSALLTESEAFLNHATTGSVLYQTYSAVPCRGYKFGTFPDEEDLESTWGKIIFRRPGILPFAP